jgi:hypothetical protein
LVVYVLKECIIVLKECIIVLKECIIVLNDWYVLGKGRDRLGSDSTL